MSQHLCQCYRKNPTCINVMVKLVRLEVVSVGLPKASLQAVMEAGTKYSDGIGFRYSFRYVFQTSHASSTVGR